MTPKVRIIGNHVYFFRDGLAFTQPAAGIASRTAKPAMNDAGWLEFGKVDKLSLTHDKDEKEIYAPSPSLLELDDVLVNKRKTTIKFDTQELSELCFELAFGSQPADVESGEYNPGAGQTIKGWLHIEQFGPDSDVVPVNRVDIYSYLSLSGDLTFDDNAIKTSIQALRLRSTLNAGTLITNNP
jgi:hypothetical protein